MQIKLTAIEKALDVASNPLIRRMSRPWTKHRLPIFMLHRMLDPERGVTGHDPEFLRASLFYLRRAGYRFVSLDELLHAECLQDRSFHDAVAFTMDDGYLDQGEIAAPIFEEFNCPVTIFVVTGFLDGTLWPWDEQIRYVLESTRNETLLFDSGGDILRYDLRQQGDRRSARIDLQSRFKRLSIENLTSSIDDLAESAAVKLPETAPSQSLPISWQLARELEQGVVRFAPHTVSHWMVSRLNANRAEFEIGNSWVRLQQELQHPLPILAWPNGTFDDFGYRDIDIARSAGLAAAVSTDPYIADLRQIRPGNAARFQISRVGFPRRFFDLIRHASWIGLSNWVINRSEWKRRFGRLRAIPRYLIAQFLFLLRFYKTDKDIDWGRVDRLVFVCYGNVCRSPYAEMVARNRGLNAVSIGLAVDERGPANPAARNEAARRGIDLSKHVSSRIADVELKSSDLILGMEPGHLRTLRNIQTKSNAQAALLGCFRRPPQPMIPDPYGTGKQFFRICFDRIDDSVDSLAKRFNVT